jgi:AraC-like DNA-binding protein
MDIPITVVCNTLARRARVGQDRVMAIPEGARATAPVVVGANWYRFAPGERIRHEHVASVCLLRAVRGRGEITSGGRTLAIEPGSLVVLPWLHDVGYRADDRAPFHLGTLHLVPWHDPGVPVTPRVAFLDDDPLLRAPFRAGAGAVGRAAVLPGGTGEGGRLAALVGYALDRLIGTDAGEPERRALGVLLLGELTRVPDAAADAVPPALAAMIDHVLGHLAERHSVAEVAAVGGCSTATAQRLFVRHTGRALHAWMQEERLRRAAELLRTTGLGVAEIAAQVGYDDPLYFSRVFRAHLGVAPSRYAAQVLRP